MPIFRPPSSEYGYAVEQIDGPTTFTVKTLNITDYPTTKVSVSVIFANGTAAANASVSASTVGGWYYWWGPNSTVNMYGETDSTGTVSLVVPTAPTVINAWLWLPLNIPVTNKSEWIKVGGEQVNVTAMWEPTYVGLAGSTLLLPPSATASITLHSQNNNYWYIRPGIYSASSPSATIASAPQGTPTQAQQSSSSQYYLPSSIPPLQSASGVPAGSTVNDLTLSTGLVEAIIIVAFAVALSGAFALVLVKRRPSNSSSVP
jgi:hypothetical protein